VPGYVATDLELRASCRQQSLAEALTTEDHFLLVDEIIQGEWIFRFQAPFDGGIGPRTRSSVERDVVNLVAPLEDLDGPARAELGACKKVEIDVAFQSGDSERNFSISTELLRRVAGVGASILVTVYPPELAAPQGEGSG